MLTSMGLQRVRHYWATEQQTLLGSASGSDSLVAQTVKRLPAMQETRIRSLGREDPLEGKMATHSSTLA